MSDEAPQPGEVHPYYVDPKKIGLRLLLALALTALSATRLWFWWGSDEGIGFLEVLDVLVVCAGTLMVFAELRVLSLRPKPLVIADHEGLELRRPSGTETERVSYGELAIETEKGDELERWIPRKVQRVPDEEGRAGTFYHLHRHLSREARIQLGRMLRAAMREAERESAAP